MDRRRFLGTATGAAVAGTAALAAPAIAQNKRELRLVTTWPKNFPGLGVAPERLAKRVAEATDGALTIKVYAAGELVGAFEAFDAVASGAADMYHGAEYYWQGKSQAFSFFTAVPFGLTAYEHNGWIYHGGGQELWDELSAKFGVKAIPCANTGVQLGGWFRREINTLEDLKGLKMRMPGLGGEVFRRLGVNIQALPGADIFPALQNGTIDATEWVGPWNDLAFGFYKVAKFYYIPGIHEPGASLALGTNLNVWNDLTPGQRAIITAACQAEDAYTYAEFTARSGPALKTLTEEHGVQVKRFSDEILQALGKTSGDVLREAAVSDEITQRVFDSFLAFRKSVRPWTAAGEEAYLAARNLDFPFE
ncbi:MAG: ABC transporter substrate-binding protein [Alphaproteobacteria bacterium]|nr:ABC transporter substrate-binding protein [Alphaproteobacteria bacterium]